jgi:tetratricopeptide (TPR) repeat protein
MTRAYVQLWDWFNQFEQEARRAGDQERIRLIQLHREAWNLRLKNPQQAYTFCMQGTQLARQLGEPCMELFHEYWATEMLLVYLIRVNDGLDLAHKIVTKSSQPRYASCPVRGRTYITLVSAYYSLDAIGYQQKISDMIEFMEREIPMDSDTHRRLQGHRVRLWMNKEDYATAEEEAIQYLSMSEGDIFREVDAYQLLTRITYYRGSEDKALQYAALRAERTKDLNDMQAHAASLMWQALILRKRGDEDEAQRLFIQSMVQYNTLGMEKNREYYEALCRFYDVKKEYEKSLVVRDEQIERVKQLGDLYWLFDTHYRRCWLLKQLNRLTPVDVEMAKMTATALQDSKKHLARLKEFEDVVKPADDVNPVLYWGFRVFYGVKRLLGGSQ